MVHKRKKKTEYFIALPEMGSRLSSELSGVIFTVITYKINILYYFSINPLTRHNSRNYDIRYSNTNR